MIGTIVAALGGLAFLAVGAGALAAPGPSSRQYGLPTADPTALALVRAVGVRDIVLGIIVIELVISGNRGALAIVLAASILAAIGDAATVLSGRRDAKLRDVTIHIGGAVALAAAWVLVRFGW
ncbi:MAG: hypothetical protein NVSMB64_03700 [Candidatus Velthaea sp.]